MNIEDISVPEVYTQESADFRFFLDWFKACLTKVQEDTDNFYDLYDPLRCPSWLLWLLCDTIGFKYDDRLPTAYNRLVLMYFMSMIRNRGSKDGVTLAAEVNLAQFNVLEYGKEQDILYDRLEDTSIPVNAVSVTPHTAQGYIDVVYFSDKVPIDACIEYVRPLGMYTFAYPGVRFDARTKISIDAKLADTNSVGTSIGPTRVGHYRRADYAKLQGMLRQVNPSTPSYSDRRNKAWYRNSEYEGTPTVDAGWRTLYSLQLCNNEHIVKSLLPPIFGLGLTPTDVQTYEGLDILPETADNPYIYNLRYDKGEDRPVNPDVTTVDEDRSQGPTRPKPAVNPIMTAIGDAIAVDEGNTKYTEIVNGKIVVVDK